MARVKRAVNAHKKRRVVLERASGYRGQRSRLYRKAKEQMLHSMNYSYRDRRARKGDFRSLWIQRINAAARQNGMTYNRFIQGLKAANIEVDRKHLADLAVTDAAAFAALVDLARAALPATDAAAATDAADQPPESPRHPTIVVTQRPIDSLRNTHVAAARSLLTRKGRTAASAFLVEGPHAVGEALATPRQRVREIFVTGTAASRDDDLLRSAVAAGVVVHPVTDRVLGSLRDTVTPQGLIAVVEATVVDLAEAFPVGGRLLVVLERIADPGNVGTIIRTADAAGADAVVTTAGSVDVWSGKSVRASAGSVLHLPVVTDVEPTVALAHANARGCTVLATAADGDRDLDDLIDAGALDSPTAWVFGNEAHGISDEARAAADQVVRIPVYGAAESLNLAAAAAICLYASARAQRR